MNKHIVRRVASLIRKAQARDTDMAFYAMSYGDSSIPDEFCGTSFCVAGWTVVDKLGSPEEAYAHIYHRDHKYQDEPTAFAIARDHMGLDKQTAQELFLGMDGPNRVPKTQVLRTLEHLAATGKVDWLIPERKVKMGAY